MITQGIDAGTGETEGLDAAGTKARSAQADAPKSLNSPTTTQGEALEALLPCPFCGGKAREVEFCKEGSASRWHRVECSNCEARGPETQGCSANYFGATRISEVAGEAIEAWNTRAALQPNIDHAVGGGLEAARSFLINHTALYEGMIMGCRSPSLEEWRAFAATLSAAWDTPPVKLDAVREDHDFVCPACMCREFARVQTADLQESDDVRCVGCKRVYSLPLATPPLDNTGLDAVPWCPTCGKTSPDGGDCLKCARWWAANPPPRDISEVGRDNIRAAIANAFVAGCEAVHENYQQDRDPSFTEAANDYASDAISVFEAALAPSDNTGLDAGTVAERAEFLVARIDELDWSGTFEEFMRDWNGHVDPPLCRLRSLLASGDRS